MASGHLGGNFAKEAFYPIEPGGRGGNEMDVETGITLKRGGDFGVPADRVVVADDAKLELGSDLLIDLAQEGQPLPMAMARGELDALRGRPCVKHYDHGSRCSARRLNALCFAGLGDPWRRGPAAVAKGRRFDRFPGPG